MALTKKLPPKEQSTSKDGNFSYDKKKFSKAIASLKWDIQPLDSTDQQNQEIKIDKISGELKNIRLTGKLTSFADYRKNERGKSSVKIGLRTNEGIIQLTLWEKAASKFMELRPIFLETLEVEHMNIDKILPAYQGPAYNEGTTQFQLKWTSKSTIEKRAPIAESDLTLIPLDKLAGLIHKLVTTHGTITNIEGVDSDQNKPLIWTLQQDAEDVRVTFWENEKEKGQQFTIGQKVLLIGAKIVAPKFSNAKPGLTITPVTLIMEA